MRRIPNFNPIYFKYYRYMANTDHDLSQFHKIGQLSERSRKIQLSYNELVESTIQYLQDTKTSPKDVIKRLDAYIPDECCQATDLDDFFFCLIPHMSFFNYDLLKMIIEQTGDNDLQGKLSNYENQFESYCRNRISGPHPVVFTSEALNKERSAEKLLIKLDAEWEGIPLADIKRFHCKVASILQVRQESLLIQKVQKGCVLFTFLIREAVALRILENGLTRSQETALQEERVMSVVIGTETLFETVSTNQ